MAKEVSELINQLGACERRSTWVHDNNIIACGQVGKFGGNHAAQLATNPVPHNGPL